MKRIFLILTIICFLPLTARAQIGKSSLGRTGVPGGSQMDRHNPFSSNYVSLTPGSYAQRNAAKVAQAYGQGHQHYGYGNRYGNNRFGNYGYGGYGYGNYGYGGNGFGNFGYSLPLIGSGYSFSSTTFTGPLLPYGYDGQWGPYSIYGPLVLPSNALYGPGNLPAGALLPGLQNAAPAAEAAPAVAAPRPFAAPENQAVKPAEVPQQANDQALRRALQFIDLGDEQFREQKFLHAYQLYQSAVANSPDLSEAYFRRGFALAEMKRYEQAAAAWKQGIHLNPQWHKSTFSLDDLYGDNRLAKQSHLELLASSLEKDPDNADLIFILGVSLYFDGQHDRSRPFLQRTTQLLEPPAEKAPVANPPAEEKAPPGVEI